VGEDGESLKFHTHQRPSWLKKDDALPCYKNKLKIV
jgi:hypothetical protein